MTVYTSTPGNGYRLQIDVVVSSQNGSAKTSTLSWAVSVINPSSNYFNARIIGSLVLGGVTVWSQSGATFNSSPAGATKVIATGSRTYSHTAGVLTVSVSGALRTENQGSSWSVPQLNASGSFTAPSFNVLPPAPNNLVYWTNDNARTVLAECASVSGTVLEYSIERSLNNGSWVAQSAALTRRIEFAGSAAPATYRFRARARNSVGWGPYGSVYTYSVAWGPAKLNPPSVEQSMSTRGFILTAPPANAFGTPIIKYQIMRRDNSSGSYGAWTYMDCNSDRQCAFIPPVPNTSFEFKARAMSASMEWKESSESNAVTALGIASGPRVRFGGVWRKTQAYVKIGGVWRKCLVYGKNLGVWKNLGS